jgi:hypothetical protein
MIIFTHQFTSLDQVRHDETPIRAVLKVGRNLDKSGHVYTFPLSSLSISKVAEMMRRRRFQSASSLVTLERTETEAPVPSQEIRSNNIGSSVQFAHQYNILILNISNARQYLNIESVPLSNVFSFARSTQNIYGEPD